MNGIGTLDIPRLGRLLSWSEVRARIPLSRTTVWVLRRAGQFPEPVRISPGRVAWRSSDVDAWLESRTTARP